MFSKNNLLQVVVLEIVKTIKIIKEITGIPARVSLNILSKENLMLV